MALKENYKDDILDVSQNVKRKYRMTENQDGTVSLEDETVYTQEGDSFGSGDINATNGKVNTIDSAVATLNANLDGFKFYPTGTGIVGLISDDSAYTDEDGNYVIWGTPTAEQLVEDNPNTYKSVPSEEDTRGKAGADTGIPFSKGAKIFDFLYYSSIEHGSLYTITNELDVDIKYMLFPLPIFNETQVKVNDEIATFEKIAIPYVESYASYDLVKLPIKKGDKLQVRHAQYGQANYPFVGIKNEVEVVATYKHPNATTTSVFTADKDYEELYVYIGGGGYMRISNYSPNIYPHPIVPNASDIAGYFYRFNNIKRGNTITFYNQYSQNANIACVFKLV